MLKKKITKILVGTNNIGKLKEIRDLLPKKLKIYSTSDFKIKSPIENGKTFEENSLIKAKYFSKKSKMICLSDDSGLEIDALEGAPGIYSARWAKKYGSFKKAMKVILQKMKKKKDRSATFVCCLVVKYSNQKIFTATGKINGSISHKIKGNKGFGYDPIFIPDSSSITFGQMNKLEKIRSDHRSIAFKKMKKKIKI